MDWSNNIRIQIAAKWLALGEVIAYPTEAVWGLGCDPFNPDAVEKILRLKRRPMEKGLILIAAHISQFAPLLQELNHQQVQKLENSWPAPITWLVPASRAVPEWIRGHHSSVALRVTNHPVAAALCRVFGGPIVSTSANPGSRREARTALAVRRYFGGQLAAITPGKVGGEKNPSEIRDLVSGRKLR
jgi:L-threonylcarbamoyladenylate synthase